MSEGEQMQERDVRARARAKKAAAAARAEGVNWNDLTREERREWKRKVTLTREEIEEFADRPGS